MVEIVSNKNETACDFILEFKKEPRLLSKSTVSIMSFRNQNTSTLKF